MKADLLSIDSKDLNQEDLLIDFFILSMCNLKCSYCIVSEERKKTYLLKKNDVDVVIDALRRSQRNIKITVLGGEPFLHPHFSYIIEELDKLPNVKQIWVFTNGTKFKPFKSTKTIISISYHLFQKQQVILDFVQTVLNSGFDPKKLNLSIMCYKMKRNLPRYIEMIEKCKELDPEIVVDIEPIIQDGKVQEREYIDKLIPFQNSDDAFIFRGKEYNVVQMYDIFDSLEMKGTCHLNRYYIGKDLVVNNYCSLSQPSNLLSDIDYFKNVKIPDVEMSEVCRKKCVLDQDIGNPKFL